MKRFVSVEFNRFLKYYKNAPDLNISEKSAREKDDNRFEKKGYKFTKFFLTIGEKDDLTKFKLMEIINNDDSLAGAEIGKIEILKGFTFFEVDARLEDKVLKAFNNRRYEGKRLKIEVKTGEQKRSTGGSRSSRPDKSEHGYKKSYGSDKPKAGYSRGPRTGGRKKT
ncbi:MAG: DbpA RNA binding domain-containing protein [Bacteroidales bacterium]|nr:DbpA RNA binding domain-containing protein [Bacteroidales bacterium]